MSEVYMIPLEHDSGEYSVNMLQGTDGQVLELLYEEYGDIVTYTVPELEYNEVRLYAIPKAALESSLKAVYSDSGKLRRLMVDINGKETLLYIGYESAQDAETEITAFAKRNAEHIIEQISACKEKAARLFVEYFNDGEYLDYHVKIGTQAEMKSLPRECVDYCGDYSAEIIKGDNDTLKVMVCCADNDEYDYFMLAVDIMNDIIREKALPLLDKTTDFKLICAEYD